MRCLKDECADEKINTYKICIARSIGGIEDRFKVKSSRGSEKLKVDLIFCYLF